VSTIRARHAGSGRRGNRSPTSCTTGSTRSQHRGQESAGVAVADDRGLLVSRAMGLVGQGFDEATLATLPGTPGDRPHPPLLHGRLVLGARPAGVQDQRRRRQDRGGPQRQPHQRRRAGRAPDSAAIAPRLACSAPGHQRHQRHRRAAGPGRPTCRWRRRSSTPRPRLEALTATAAPAGIGPTQGLCMTWFTGSYPIPTPDAAGADLRPSAATQPATLPLPNP
jgi:hypothetical protein